MSEKQRRAVRSFFLCVQCNTVIDTVRANACPTCRCMHCPDCWEYCSILPENATVPPECDPAEYATCPRCTHTDERVFTPEEYLKFLLQKHRYTQPEVWRLMIAEVRKDDDAAAATSQPAPKKRKSGDTEAGPKVPGP